MNWQSFLIGLMIGFVSAIVGGVVEYLLVRQRGDEQPQETERLPGCMLLISGSLGGAGMLAIAFSLLVSGEVIRMLVTGLGVGTGFFGGFILMMLLWFLFNQPDRPDPEL